MAKMGRPEKYFSVVVPRFDDIKDMLRTMTEQQISKDIGIAYSTWCDYKNRYPEFSELIRVGRKALIKELKSTLIKKAKGYSYTEKKTVRKKNGDTETEYTEEYTKYAQPDTGAIHLLLKNLDETWRNDDKETMDIKRRQVELAERKLDNEVW